MSLHETITIQPVTDPPTEHCAAVCEPILRSLEEWFGQEESTLAYIRESDAKPTILACAGDRVVGFLTLNQHFDESAEIHCVAVMPDLHRFGVGRMLLEHAEQWCRERGISVLQVKTVAAQRECPAYEKTRAFYRSVGFIPLEVFPTLWEEATPCLQLVKPIQ